MHYLAYTPIALDNTLCRGKQQGWDNYPIGRGVRLDGRSPSLLIRPGGGRERRGCRHRGRSPKPPPGEDMAAPAKPPGSRRKPLLCSDLCVPSLRRPRLRAGVVSGRMDVSRDRPHAGVTPMQKDCGFLFDREGPIDREHRRPAPRRAAAAPAAGHRGRAQGELPQLRDVGDHQPGVARRPRRPEAVAAADPGGDARPGAQPGRLDQQVRGHRRRDDEAVSPARRQLDLSHAGPHGPVVEHAAPADHRAGELRLDPRPAAGGDAVHRGQAQPGRRRDARGHQARHRRLPAQLRREVPGAPGPARQVPQPAGQRLGRHRRRHGDVDPAAQPGRGLRRRWSPTSTTRRSTSTS